MNAVWLVAGREIQTRLRSKSFIYSTIFTVVLFGLIAFVPSLLSQSGPTNVAVVAGDSEALVKSITDPELKPIVAEDNDAARELVVSGKAKGGLVPQDGGWVLYTTPDTSVEVEQALTTAAQTQASQAEMDRQGVDQQAITDAVTAATPQKDLVVGKSPDVTTIITAFIVGLLLFFQIFTYGNMVALGVIEEKSSRVVEILLSTISARSLLVGKVLGIGLVGLVQLMVFLAVGVIVGTAAGFLHLDTGLIGTALLSLAWFIPGYLFYAFAYGAAGSLVSRQEEAGSVTAPLMVLVLASYMACVFAIQDLGAPWLQPLSIIPPFSALLMPLRIAAGRAEGWEIVLALGLLIAATVVIALLGAVIYQRSVLRVGSRVKLSEALKKS